jgi:fermentation-respiration switch protein FrsA (DUF1100 family)
MMMPEELTTEARRARRKARGARQRLVVFFIAVLVLAGCTSSFFKPGRTFVANPEVQALSPRDVLFRSPDGLQLHGWFFRAQGGVKRGTILVCHGNVENISTHVKLDLWLVRAGFDLFIFDYRGYGRSEGETTVDGIHLDAEAALETLLSLPGMEQERVIIYGKSLGGAVSVPLAATTPRRDRIKGLIVESAFADYRMKAREEIVHNYGWFVQYPLSLLVNNDYSSRKFIAKVSPIPVLILHGDQDAVVPVEHGRILYEEARDLLYWSPGLGHEVLTDEGRQVSRLIEPPLKRRVFKTPLTTRVFPLI